MDIVGIDTWTEVIELVNHVVNATREKYQLDIVDEEQCRFVDKQAKVTTVEINDMLVSYSWSMVMRCVDLLPCSCCRQPDAIGLSIAQCTVAFGGNGCAALSTPRRTTNGNKTKTLALTECGQPLLLALEGDRQWIG